MKTYFNLTNPNLGLDITITLDLSDKYIADLGATDLDFKADLEPIIQAVLDQYLPSDGYIWEIDYPIRYRVKRFKTLMARLAELKPKSEEPSPNSEAKPAQLEQPILEQNINGEAKHD